MRHLQFEPIVFSIGFFALGAQTLLLRDYLTAFDGTELAIGGFFSSWLLWISLGALASRAAVRHPVNLAERLFLCTLLYIPAFLFQRWMLLNSRDILGLEAFDVIGLQHILALPLLANSLISFLTGFMFSFACELLSGPGEFPVAKAYAVETLGGFSGGVGVTFTLAVGFTPERVFLLCSIVLACGLVASRLRRSNALIACCSLIVLLIVLVLGMDAGWARRRQESQWGRLLPREALKGAFTTAQNEYLFGRYHGEFLVMSWGGVGESLPNEQHAGEILALTLSQNPNSRNVLVIGNDGLAISRLLFRLPQIEKITWCHFDPGFVPGVLGVLPEEFRKTVDRIEFPRQDIVSFLGEGKNSYDLVLLNIPDPTTLVLNRFLSLEFIEKLRSSLAEDGVLCLRVSGGANYLGQEYSYLGASALSTLESLFPVVVLKPGDETWMIASRKSDLITDPAILRDRFAAIPGAPDIYRPDGILSLYPLDRIEFQLRKYRAVIENADAGSLINSEQQPLGLLYGLLLLLRTTGHSVSSVVEIIRRCGLAILLAVVTVYALLRCVFMWRGHGAPAEGKAPSLFDAGVLLLVSGFVGISLSILLIFQYQSRFGSLFLEIGLISGLFMLGIYAGTEGVRFWLKRSGTEHPQLLPLCIGAHILFVGIVSVFSAHLSKPGFVPLFLLAGVFTGAYVPIGAARAGERGLTSFASGAWVEGLDNLGGCVGSLAASLILVPVLGQESTLLFLGALIVAQGLPALLPFSRAQGPSLAPDFNKLIRATGYWLFGIGCAAAIASQIVASNGRVDHARSFAIVAREIAGIEAELVLHTKPAADGRNISYYSFKSSGGSEEHFILDTCDLGTSQVGYGGPVHLAVCVNQQGNLVGFRVFDSRETPSYLRSLTLWAQTLTGKELKRSMRGVDSVTSATLTSRAILRTLEQTGQSFSRQILGIVDSEDLSSTNYHRAANYINTGILLMVLFAGSLAIRWAPGFGMRRLRLLVMFLLCGWWFNLQYSTQQVFSLLSLAWPPAAITASFFLIVLVPVLTLLFGNVYCGHLCPFGALQELIGDLRPSRLKTDPPKNVSRYGHLVKYWLLFLSVVFYSITRENTILSVDPLITFFSQQAEPIAIIIAVVTLSASFLYRRFWCRNLCPAGAFLALLSGIHLLKKWFPRTDPSRCDLGVRRREELDCIGCDRCRHGVE